MHIINDRDNSEETDKYALAFRAVGLFLYEFSQLEFTIRGILGGKKKQPDMSPDNFSTLCMEAEAFFTQKRPEHAKEIIELFDKCLELNKDRMIVVQGFGIGNDGGIAPSFVSPNSQKAHHYYTHPDELKKLAATARKISDKFLEKVVA